MGICLIDIQRAGRYHTAGPAGIDGKRKSGGSHRERVLTAVGGRRRRTHGRRGGEGRRRDPRNVKRDRGGVLQGRGLVRRSFLVEALVTDPSRRASVTNRLCGVAFLVQPPGGISLTPQLSDQHRLRTFFFRLSQKRGNNKQTAPKARQAPSAYRHGIHASPLRKLSLVGFEVGVS